MSTSTTSDLYNPLIINQTQQPQVDSSEQSATQSTSNLSISSLSPLPQPSTTTTVRFEDRPSSYSFATTATSSIYHYPSVIGSVRDRPIGSNVSPNDDTRNDNHDEGGDEGDDDHIEHTSIRQTSIGDTTNNPTTTKKQHNNPLTFITFNQDLYYTYAPLLTYFTAFLLAWIYTMIPSNNYYVFFLIKGEFWNILATGCFVEIFLVTIPDIHDEIYILVYLIGWLICPFYYILAKVTDYDNTSVATVVTIVPLLGVVLGFGYNVLTFPFSYDQLKRERVYQQRQQVLATNVTGNGTVTDENNNANTVITTKPFKFFQSMIAATRISRLSSTSSSTDTITSPIALEMGIGDRSTLEEENRSTDQGSSLSPSLLLSNGNHPQKLFPNWISSILHRKYFFFLPKYWKWYQWHRVSKLPHNVDRRFLWITISLLVFLFTIDYLFLVFFTHRFRHSSRSFNESVKLFFAYIIVTTVFRIVMKFLGMQLDKYRNKTVSMYFIGEVMGLLYYYTFYRVLFESIHSVSEFIIFQIFHLASEWILYCFRSSERYFQWSEQLATNQLLKLIFSNQHLSYQQWQAFIALDFGIRCSIFVSTGYGILLLLVTIQFIPWVGDTNGLQQDLVGFRYTTVFLFCAVVLELINAWIMVKYYFEPKGLDVLRMTRHCYSLRAFAFLSMLIAANLFINPVYAFTTIPS